MPQNPRHQNPFRILYALLAAAGCLFLIALLIPVLDGPHSRQYANEAAVVSKLRALTTLETTYAAAHLDKGFACELPQLRQPEHDQNSSDYEPLRFLATETTAGYKVVLGNCRTDVKGVVVHYEAAAIPVQRGRTGVRAFCTDDSGLLWYDAEGSATNCQASHRPIQ
jgi:hypothetical protein